MSGYIFRNTKKYLRQPYKQAPKDIVLLALIQKLKGRRRETFETPCMIGTR